MRGTWSAASFRLGIYMVHSHVGGNPDLAGSAAVALDSRFRGNDNGISSN
jgi:hypothetical protein